MVLVVLLIECGVASIADHKCGAAGVAVLVVLLFVHGLGGAAGCMQCC